MTMATLAPPAAAEPDHWSPIRRLVGEWSGAASGQAGDGKVKRKYTFVLGEKYLHEINDSDYPPQEKNQSGEHHAHWGMFSFDKKQKSIVLRHFHVEGFVNTYRQVAAPERSNTVVFESEAFENFSNAWKARETYEFVTDDEVVEIFELAPPGKPFQLYSRNHLKRVR